jgi:hypothetical protein
MNGLGIHGNLIEEGRPNGALPFNEGSDSRGTTRYWRKMRMPAILMNGWARLNRVRARSWEHKGRLDRTPRPNLAYKRQVESPPIWKGRKTPHLQKAPDEVKVT